MTPKGMEQLWLRTPPNRFGEHRRILKDNNTGVTWSQYGCKGMFDINVVWDGPLVEVRRVEKEVAVYE